MGLELKMKDAILDFPLQFKRGLKSGENVTLKHYAFISPPSNIIICGMGGSALPAEILADLTPLNIFVHKSYGLPLQAGNGSIIICASYSGDTEETVSAFKESLSRKLPLIAITGGGKLAKLARENNVPLALLPGPRMQPRYALGLQFAALIRILGNHYLLPDNLLKEVSNLSLKPKTLEKKGKELARKIGKKIPLIYVPEKLKGLGLYLKNNFNENAKTLAFCNRIPEMNHNEIVGFWKVRDKEIKGHIFPIILRDKNDNLRILKRIGIMEGIFKEEGIQSATVDISGKNVLEIIFSSSLLGLWASYYLALDYNVDPTRIKIIEEIKNRLKK